MLNPGGLIGPKEVLCPVQLVEHLLEPELIDLMDHDEEHLVVLRPFGAGLLQGEQLIQVQVSGIGQSHKFILRHLPP